ncbi:transposase [uncultured Ruminococcus sp.]|uniref:IS66 family transposase n=1 Tax=uncultured Ruminococcus sp. TaxID=165186 RepID=UPI00338D7FE4
MNAFFAWAKSRRNIALKSKLGKAVNYLIEEEPYLRRYIEDGRLQIDHNRAELKQQNQVISISATVNLHGGCFDGYILKKMLTAAEISSVFVTASYICFPTNISVLQQNKRQLNSLPLVILIYSVFSGYPNY